MKRILDFSYADARRFLLKEGSYYNFDLPKYFVFQELLDQISQEIKEKPLSDYYGNYVDTSGKTKTTRPCDYENVNHKFLNNKDGKFAWRPLQLKGKIMSNTSKTDWARIDAMSDDEIETSDIPPLTDDFFSNAKLRMPSYSLATVTIHVDPEKLLWFQSKGEEAEQHMAAALRIYAQAQKNVANIRQSA
jgi:uncharacterized protein (DUF4415 family)